MPLPDGLRSAHVQCVLGEDVVLLFEFSVGDLESPASQDREGYIITPFSPCGAFSVSWSPYHQSQYIEIETV